MSLVGTAASIHVRRPLRGTRTARRRPDGIRSGGSSHGGGADPFLALPSADRSARVGRASRLSSCHSRWTAGRRRRHCWHLPTCAVGKTAAAANVRRRASCGGTALVVPAVAAS